MFLQTFKVKDDVAIEEISDRQRDTHGKDAIRFGGKNHVVKSPKIRAAIIDLYLQGERLDRLEEVTKAVETEKDLETHLEKILGLERRAFNEMEDLERAIESFHLSKQYRDDPTHPWAPWNLEGVVRAYAETFDEEDLNLLFYFLLDEKSGGLGYTIKKGGISAYRWEFDYKKKALILPQNEFGVIFSDRTNQSAAETLRDALREELKGEESTGSKVQRIGSGAVMVIGGTVDVVVGVIGVIAPEPVLTKVAGASLIALGSSQFTEGVTKIVAPNKHGQGFNPLEEGAAIAGRSLAGEKGETVARYSFMATNLIVTVGASSKIVKIAKTEAENMARLKRVADELNELEIQKIKKAAEKFEITTEKGSEIYSRIHKAVETLPNELRKAPPLGEFKGMRIKRIKVGNDPEKIAIIGRVMGNPEGTTMGVNAVKQHFKKHGIDLATFDMPGEDWEEFKRAVEMYRNIPGKAGAMLPPQNVMKLKAFQSNKAWAEMLKKRGYTILDLGDPIGKNEFSPFYSIEKKILFGKEIK